MPRRIAIFGGSFDPVHTGHAIIASHVMQAGLADQLWLMVTPENPFKSGQRLSAEYHRLRMAAMVSVQIPGVVTSAFELQLPRPTYTAHTLRALREKFPGDEFLLLIGADNWVAWERWRQHDEILEHHRLLVYPRLGCDITIPSSLADRVTCIDAPIIEISSTQIRSMIASGGTPYFYAPSDVLDYAMSHRLYSTDEGSDCQTDNSHNQLT